MTNRSRLKALGSRQEPSPTAYSLQPAATVQRLVVKVGASVLTDARGRLLAERITPLADQLAACAREGRQPLLVSSGAIACGMAKLGLSARPKPLAQLQACAAIGQSELMHLYTLAFARHGVSVAQVLLTQEDLADRLRFRNAKQTLLTLLHRRVLPIINENDTVAVEEITFGDNDRLAALVASAVDAHLLVILSDVEGFLQHGKLVERIEAVNQIDRRALAQPTRGTTKGGMASKLEAARIAGHSGIPLIIANGTRPSALGEILAGKPVGTLCVPPRARLTSRKWWIAFALRQPRGTIVIDDGAAHALSERGSSLLASGVRQVRGRFEAGAFVAVADVAGRELARGVAGYSSAELARVRGGKTVIPRGHLVLTKDLQR